jgi:hypothetical protein
MFDTPQTMNDEAATARRGRAMRHDLGSALLVVMAAAAVLFVTAAAVVGIVVFQQTQQARAQAVTRATALAQQGMEVYLSALRVNPDFWVTTPTIAGTGTEGTWTVAAKLDTSSTAKTVTAVGRESLTGVLHVIKAEMGDEDWSNYSIFSSTALTLGNGSGTLDLSGDVRSNERVVLAQSFPNAKVYSANPDASDDAKRVSRIDLSTVNVQFPNLYTAASRRDTWSTGSPDLSQYLTGSLAFFRDGGNPSRSYWGANTEAGLEPATAMNSAKGLVGVGVDFSNKSDPSTGLFYIRSVWTPVIGATAAARAQAAADVSPQQFTDFSRQNPVWNTGQFMDWWMDDRPLSITPAGLNPNRNNVIYVGGSNLDVYVSGSFFRSVTIVSERDIYIIGDITRSTAAGADPSSTVGLVAKGNIYICSGMPQTTNQSANYVTVDGTTNGYTAKSYIRGKNAPAEAVGPVMGQNLTIQASMMAVDGAIIMDPENPDQLPAELRPAKRSGTLTIKGSLISNLGLKGPNFVRDLSSWGGFAHTVIGPDPMVNEFPPPMFPTIGQGALRVDRWDEYTTDIDPNAGLTFPPPGTYSDLGRAIETGDTTVNFVQPPSGNDHEAPITVDNVQPEYTGQAVITLVASDVGDKSPVYRTWYQISGDSNTYVGSTIEIPPAAPNTVQTMTVTYWSQDMAGNIEPKQTVSFTMRGIDTEPAFTTVVDSQNPSKYLPDGYPNAQNGDKPYVVYGEFQPLFSAREEYAAGLGVEQIWVIRDGTVVRSVSGSSIDTGTMNVDPPSMGFQDLNYVYYSIDKAGNREVSRHLTVRQHAFDRVAPMTTHDAGNGVFLGNATVRLTGTDDLQGQGIGAVAWHLEGGGRVLDGTSYNTTEGVMSLTASVVATAPPRGSAPTTYTLSFRSRDLATTYGRRPLSNFEEETQTIPLVVGPGLDNDVTKPVTSSDATTTYIGPATILLTATDAGGVDRTQWWLDGGPEQVGTTVSVADALAAVVHKLQFRSIDLAGNIEDTKTAMFTVFPENIPPITAAHNDDLYAGTALFQLSAEDNVGGSGLESTWYSIDGARPFTRGITTPLGVTWVQVDGDGLHTIEYYSMDRAGNSEAIKTCQLRIDTTAPTTTAMSNGTTVTAPITASGQAVVSLNAQDDGSGIAYTHWRNTADGVEQITNPVLLGAGTWDVEYWSVDKAGNAESPKTFHVTVTAAPDVTPPDSYDDVKPYYKAGTNPAATIHLYSWDVQTGVKTMYWRLDSVAHTFDGKANPPASYEITVTAEGTHTLEYRADDKASPTNTEDWNYKVFVVDTISPTTTCDARQGAKYYRNVSFPLHGTDSGSGVAGTYYTLDGGVTVKGTSVYVAAPRDGFAKPHVIQYWSVDNAGNVEAAKSVSFKSLPIDLTAPITTAQGSAISTTTAIVSLVATDNVGGSGVDFTSYKLDGGAETTCIATPASPYRIQLSDAKVHTLEYWSTDIATNIELPHKTATYTVDSMPPYTTILGWRALYNGTANITLSASDATGTFGGTAVANTFYVLDGVLTTGTPPNTPVTVSAVGPHTLSYWSVDGAGNTETSKTVSFKIDTTKPTTRRSDNSSEYFGKAAFTLIAQDEAGGSGLGPDATQYRVVTYRADWSTQTIDPAVSGTAVNISGPTSGTPYPRGVIYWSTDLAGNVEDQHVATFTIAAQAPMTFTDMYPAENTTIASRVTTVSMTGHTTDGKTISTVIGKIDGVWQQVSVVYPGGTGVLVPAHYDYTPVTLVGTFNNINQYWGGGPYTSWGPDIINDAPYNWSTYATFNLSGYSAGDLSTAKLAWTVSAGSSGADYGYGTKKWISTANNDYAHALAVWSVTQYPTQMTGFDSYLNSKAGSTASFYWDANPGVVVGYDDSGCSAYSYGEYGMEYYMSLPTLTFTKRTWVPDTWTGGTPADNTTAKVSFIASNLLDGQHTASFTFTNSAGAQNTMTWNFGVGAPADTIAPVTTSNAAAMYSAATTISLTATDEVGGTGVAATCYKLDGGATTTSTVLTTLVPVSAAGSHNIEFWSVDRAGNVESHKTVAFVLDWTAPVTTAGVGTGYEGTATVYLSARDNLGGAGIRSTLYNIDGGALVAAPVAPAAGSGVIGLWQFDEGAGTALADSSGSGFNATLNIGAGGTQPNTARAWTNGAIGKFNASLNFDGTDDYVNVGSQTALNNLGNNFTVAAWVKTSVNAGTQTIAGRGNDWRLEKIGASYTFEHRNASNNIVMAQAMNTATDWVYVVGTFDSVSGTVKLYLNGALVATQAQTGTTRVGQTQTQIGNDYAWHSDGTYNDYYWNGQMDAVAISSVTRSAAEVASAYSGPPAPGVIGQWHFDEGSGNTVIDSSGSGLNGTATIGAGGTQTSASQAWSAGNSGKFGKSMNFDGVDDYVDLGSSAILNNLGDTFSVGAWVKTSVNSGTQIVASRSNDWVLQKSGNSYQFSMWNDVTAATVSAVNTSTDWVYVVATYNSPGKSLNLYLNGTLASTQTFTGPTRRIKTQNQIGNGYMWHTGGVYYNDNYWNGQIDEVSFSNIARSAADISAYYAASSGGDAPPTAVTVLGPAYGSPISHTINYYSLDNAGNVETTRSKSFNVAIRPDYTPPTTTPTNLASYLKPSSFTLVATDNAGGSGVASTWFQVDYGTVLAQDNFNGANRALTGPWAPLWGGVASAGIASNQATITSPVGNTECVYVNTGFTATADMLVQMTLTNALTANDSVAPAARVTPGANPTAYFARFSRNSVTFQKRIAVSPYWVGVGSGTTISGPNPGDVIGLGVQGSTLTAYLNGVAVATASDTSLTGAGYGGFRVADGVGPSVVNFDDWSVQAPGFRNGTAVSTGSLAGTHTVSFYSVDLAGNVESTKTAQFYLTPDVTPPVTTHNGMPSYDGAATIQLSATDGGWGVANTYFRIDSGADTTGSTIVVPAPVAGTVSHTIYFWSIDAAGNREDVKSYTFGVNGLPYPMTWSAITPTPGAMLSVTNPLVSITGKADQEITTVTALFDGIPVAVNPLVFPMGGGGANSQAFGYTGGNQSFTVPPGITSLTVDLAGAEGGEFNGGWGGWGGSVHAVIPVTPGQTFTIRVGGASGGSGAGGWPNGGAGAHGGSGGGSSSILFGSSVWVEAGGGGGGACDGPDGYGGGDQGSGAGGNQTGMTDTGPGGGGGWNGGAASPSHTDGGSGGTSNIAIGSGTLNSGSNPGNGGVTISWGSVGVDKTQATASFQTSSLLSGSHTATMTYTVASGGMASKSWTFLVDNIAPVTTSSVLPSYMGTATVYLGAKDNFNGSGIATTHYRIDGGADTMATAPVTNDVIGLWHLDEGSGATAADSSRFANTATVSGTHNTGKFGNGLTFTAALNHYAKTNANVAQYDVGGQLTLGAWFKTSTVQSGKFLVMHDESDYKYGIYMTANSTALCAYIKTASGTTSTSYTLPSGNYADNQWHYLAMTFDKFASGNRLKVYVDGVLRGQANAFAEDILAGDEGITIGRWGSATFDGQIDEVTLRNTVQTPDTVGAYYAAGNLSDVPPMSLDVPAPTSGTISHTLTYWSIDNAGNSEQVTALNTRTFGSNALSDVTPPTTTCDALTTYPRPATFNLSAADNVGGWGFKYTCYKTDNGAVTTSTVPNNVVSTGNVSGTHYLYYWSIDQANNKEATKTATYTITPDVTPPTTTSNVNTTTAYNGSASISLTASDGVGWGVDYTKWAVDNGATQTVNYPTQASFVVSAPINGSAVHHIDFYSVDKSNPANVEAVNTATFTVAAVQAPMTFSGYYPAAGSLNKSTNPTVSVTAKALSAITTATATLDGTTSTVTLSFPGGSGTFVPGHYDYQPVTLLGTFNNINQYWGGGMYTSWGPDIINDAPYNWSTYATFNLSGYSAGDLSTAKLAWTVSAGCGGADYNQGTKKWISTANNDYAHALAVWSVTTYPTQMTGFDSYLNSMAGSTASFYWDANPGVVMGYDDSGCSAYSYGEYGVEYYMSLPTLTFQKRVWVPDAWVGGSGAGDNTTATASFPTAGLPTGTHTATVTFQIGSGAQAQTSWSFFVDGVAPTTTATVSPSNTGTTTLYLGAMDDVGGSGVRYTYDKLGTGPLTVAGNTAFSASGGVQSQVGGNTIIVFNSSSSLVCSGTLNGATVMVVGGGGGGGARHGFGGGAGKVVSGTVNLSGTMPITVGNGGSGAVGGNYLPIGAAPADTAQPGGTTTAFGLTANGGSQGFQTSGGASGNGFSAGAGYYTSPYYFGAGGGGSTGVGGNATISTVGAGGPGYTTGISGSSVVYAKGGSGGSYNNQTVGIAGAANTGSGGSAGGGETNGGGAGGSGVVIISYPTPIPTAAILSGTIGLWHLNEATGTVINDASGNGVTGSAVIGSTGSQTTVGQAWTNGAAGKFGKAMNFDGTDDYVNLGISSAAINNVDSFSVGAWVKSSNTTNMMVAVGRSEAWRLYRQGSTYYFMHRGTDNNLVYATGTNSSTDWVYIVGTFDAATKQAKLYINGVLAGTQTQTTTTIKAYNQLQIGNSYAWHTGSIWYNDFHWQGQIDEVSVSNVARTATEIQNYYNAGIASDVPPMPVSIQAPTSGTSAYTMQFFSDDIAGNVEATKSITFNVTAPSDTTSPTTAINGIQQYFRAYSTLSLTAIDNVGGWGVNYSMYRLNWSNTPGTWYTYSTPGFQNGSTQGTYTVDYYSVDKAGNTEIAKTASFTLDWTPPVTTPNTTATTFSGMATITLNATDYPQPGGSGVANTWWRIDGAGNWTTGTVATVQGPVTGSATHYIQYYSSDLAGNVEGVKSTGNFGVGSVPAAITWSNYQPPQSFDVTATHRPTISIKGTSTSGLVITAATMSVNGTPVVPTTVGSNTTSMTTNYVPTTDLPDGSYTVVVVYTVAGGAQATTSWTWTIHGPDNMPPVTSTSAGATYVGTATISLTATDYPQPGCAGVRNTYFKIDSGSYTIGNTAVVSPPVWGNPVPHTIYYYSDDNASPTNTEIVKSYTFTVAPGLDPFAPTTTSNVTSQTYASPLTVVLTASDNAGGTGVGATYYKLDGTQYTYGSPFVVPLPTAFTQFHTLEFWSQDRNLPTANVETPHNFVNFTMAAASDNTSPSTTSNALSWYKVPQSTITLTPSDVGWGVNYTHWLLTKDGVPGTPTDVTYPTAVSVPTGTSQGVYKLEFYAVDKAGNRETTKTSNYVVDTTAPTTTSDWTATYTVTAFINISAADSHPASSGVNATWYKVDSGAYTPYSGMVRVDGPTSGSPVSHTISYYSADNAGNVESATVKSFKITAAPESQAPVTAATYKSAYNTTSATISLNATDYPLVGGWGVQYTHYVLTSLTATWTSGEQNYTGPITVGPQGQGSYRLDFYSVDNNSNRETTKSVNYVVDLTAPTSTTDRVPSYTATATIGIWSTDIHPGASGVASMYYKWDASSTYTTYTGIPVVMYGPTSGPPVTHTLWYYATDLATNTEIAKSTTFTVSARSADVDKPTTTIIGQTIYNATSTISLSATDNPGGWGVASTSYILTSMTTSATTGETLYTGPFSTGGQGQYQLQAWSIDFAGNRENTKTLNYVVDTTKPVTSSDVVSTYTVTAYITLTPTDVHPGASGVAYTKYMIDSGAPATYTIGVPITIAGPLSGAPATHTLDYWSVDNATNVEVLVHKVFKITATADGQPPVTTSNRLPFYGVGTYTITLTANDAGWGVASTWYSLDNATAIQGNSVNTGGAGGHTLKFWSIDNANNQEAANTVTYTVDVAPPTTTTDRKANYIGKAFITLSADDATGSGVKSTTYSVDDSGSVTTTTSAGRIVGIDPPLSFTSGVHHIDFYSTDNVNNVEASKLVTFTITAATDTVVPTSWSNNQPTYARPGTFTITANDTGWGLKTINYQIDSAAPVVGYNAGSTGNILSATCQVGTTGAGTHTLKMWAVDQYGLSETTHTATYTVSPDTQKPVTTTDARDTIGNATVSLTATDNGGWGVDYTRYRLDDSAPITYSGSFTVNDTITGDAVHHIDYWSADLAGNVEDTKTTTFTVSAKPAYLETYTVLPANGAIITTNTIPIRLTAKSNLNISSVTMTLDGAAISPAVAMSSIYTTASITATGVAVGDHTVKAIITVAGGRQAPVAWTFTVQYQSDFTPPNTVWSNYSPPYFGHADISLVASDNPGGTGVDFTKYRVDGAAWTTMTTSIPVSGPATGTAAHTVDFYSVDKAGNKEQTRTQAFQINAGDNTPPVTGSNAKGFYQAPDVIQLTSDDGPFGTGIAHIYYSLDGAARVEGTTIGTGGTGNHVLRFLAVDNANNWEATKTVEYKVDPNAPVTTSDAVENYTGAAEIHLFPDDAGGTGVDHTYYRVDQGDQREGTVITVAPPTAGSTTHDIYWWSTDYAGNIEATNTYEFQVAAPADTQAPDTRDDIRSPYAVPGLITLTPHDDGWGVDKTYYSLDGAVPVVGITLRTGGPGDHTLKYWSVDKGNNSETTHSVPYTVIADDSQPPTTTSDAKPSYVGSATISMTATDNCGVLPTTYFKLDDTGVVTTGTVVHVAGPRTGTASHTLYFWSIDLNGQRETTRHADFTIQQQQAGMTFSGVYPADGTTILVRNPVITVSAASALPIVNVVFEVDGQAKAPVITNNGTTAAVSYAAAGLSGDSGGVHSVTAVFTDTLGASSMMSWQFTVNPPVDAQAPTISDDGKPTYRGPATINIFAADELGGSGVAATYWKLDGNTGWQSGSLSTTTVNVTAIGAHYIQYYAVDAKGNTTGVNRVDFKIDVTPPVTGSDFRVAYSGTNGVATITLSPVDPSPGTNVAATYYIVDGGAPQTGTVIVIPAPISNSATHTLYWWSVDGAGNKEATVGPKVTKIWAATDATPPHTISDAKTTYALPSVISLTASDNVGGWGVAHTYYVLDGGPQTEATILGTGGAGGHDLYFWSVDAYGNEELPHEYMHYTVAGSDTTKPHTTSNAATSYSSLGAIISLTATDPAPASGVAHTYYRYDDGPIVEATFVGVTGGNGSHHIDFWSVDWAGNQEDTQTATFTIALPDTQPPLTSSDAQASYTGTATISLTATDFPQPGGAGVRTTFYRIDGSIAQEGVTIVIAPPAHGAPVSHTISFWSVDKGSITESEKTKTFTVGPPILTTVTNAAPTYTGSVTLSLVATDNGSGLGIAHTYYRLDNASSKTEGVSAWVAAPGSGSMVHHLYYWSVDTAGHVEGTKTLDFTVNAAAAGTAYLSFRWSPATAAWADLRVLSYPGRAWVQAVHLEGTGTQLFWTVDVPSGVQYYMQCSAWADGTGGSTTPMEQLTPVLTAGQTYSWDY